VNWFLWRIAETVFSSRVMADLSDHVDQIEESQNSKNTA